MTTPKPERMTDADLAACAERIGLAADHGEAASPDDAHALADEAIRANSGEEHAGRERDDAREQAQHLLNGLSAIEVATAASDREKAALRARVAELDATVATTEKERDALFAERDLARARVVELEAKLARLASNSALGPIPFMLDDSPQSAELRLRMEFAAQALKPTAPPKQAPQTDDGVLRERLTRLETVLRVGAELAVARADAEPASHDLTGYRMLAAWSVGAMKLLNEAPALPNPTTPTGPVANGYFAHVSDELLASSPSKLEISLRAYNALMRAGIETVRDLLGMTRAEVEALRGMGKKSASRLAEDLFAYGLTFMGDECICLELEPPLYYSSCPHPKHRIGTVMPDRISNTDAKPRTSDATGPKIARP